MRAADKFGRNPDHLKVMPGLSCFVAETESEANEKYEYMQSLIHPIVAREILSMVLGYADFRFADCGWRKAYPKLDAFHQKMLERPSVKISVPPPA